MRTLLSPGMLFFPVSFSNLPRRTASPDREGWQVIPTDKPYQALVDDLKAAIKADEDACWSPRRAPLPVPRGVA